MRIVESHSRLHGEAFATVHRPSLFGELGHLIEGLRLGDVDQKGEPHGASVRQDRRLTASLDSLGWLDAIPSPVRTFVKDRIALKFCFNLDRTEAQRELAELCARYRNDEIDLGVAVLQMEPEGRGSQIASFAAIVDNLKGAGRIDTAVPLLLLGVAE